MFIIIILKDLTFSSTGFGQVNGRRDLDAFLKAGNAFGYIPFVLAFPAFALYVSKLVKRNLEPESHSIPKQIPITHHTDS